MKGFGLSDGWVQDSFGLERFAGVNIKSVLKMVKVIDKIKNLFI